MKLIPNGVSRNVAMTVLKAKKQSPHIFFGLGVVGVVGSAVLACRATLKLEKVIDEIHTDIQDVKETHNPSRVPVKHRSADATAYHKDLIYVYTKSAVAVGRLYGPSVVLGAASIGALTGSHVQLTRRNSALTATLAVVAKAYDDYRARIQEELGEERELAIYHDIQTETIGTGAKKQVIKSIGSRNLSPYAVIFDESNPNWKPDPEYNRMFIECQLRYLNNKLNARGHVLLNDVFDHLDMDRTSAGMVVGWLRNGDGDGYIDFGLYDANNSEFLFGSEPSIWLDFNVDGNIWEKI